jgi:hypothetical protein
MRSISATVDIAATPERVWAVLADLAAYPEWNPFIRSASGKLAEGARLTLRMAPAGGRAMTFRPTVLAARPGELLRWIGRLIVPGIFDGTHQFALEDLGGRTRLTQSETFRGLLVPITGTTMTRTEAGFHASTRRSRSAPSAAPRMTGPRRLAPGALVADDVNSNQGGKNDQVPGF